MESKNLTRTGIMMVLAKVVDAALTAIEGFNPTDTSHLRRTCRALTHLAIKRLLDAGAPPEFVAAQLSEALYHELAEREAAAKAQVTEAQAEGGAAILTLPTKGGTLPN